MTTADVYSFLIPNLSVKASPLGLHKYIFLFFLINYASNGIPKKIKSHPPHQATQLANPNLTPHE